MDLNPTQEKLSKETKVTAFVDQHYHHVLNFMAADNKNIVLVLNSVFKIISQILML